MKTILNLSIVILFSIQVSAQNKIKDYLPLKNEKVTFSKVINIDETLSRDDIYKHAKKWLAYNFETIKYEYRNMNDGDELIARGYFVYKNMYIWETITIKIIQLKYKYEFTDFEIKYTNNNNSALSTVDSPLEKFDDTSSSQELYSEIDKQINNMGKALQKAIINFADDIW